MLRLMTIVFGLTLAGGCCFLPLHAGTWEDDEGNWRRAFGFEKPDDVVVVHSWYFRSAHWTYEYEYYFKLEKNETLREELISNNGLVKRTDYDDFDRDSWTTMPEWFAPKELSAYEVWEGEDNLQLLMDKESGHLFLRDWQF